MSGIAAGVRAVIHRMQAFWHEAKIRAMRIVNKQGHSKAMRRIGYRGYVQHPAEIIRGSYVYGQRLFRHGRKRLCHIAGAYAAPAKRKALILRPKPAYVYIKHCGSKYKGLVGVPCGEYHGPVIVFFVIQGKREHGAYALA